jgi:histidyl-tRNA synthetase
MLDYLCSDCRDHFATVMQLLEQTEQGYQLNPRLVRGLDYYCRTAFEWASSALGAQSALAAGGRYDGLVQDLGGPPTPGVGFAIGLERLVLLLGMKEGKSIVRPAIYVAWLGKAAQGWVFPLVRGLRRKGIAVEMDGGEKSLKSLMRRADKMRALLVLIVGDEELRKGKGIIRNMDSKEQYEVDLERIGEYLMERIASR